MNTRKQEILDALARTERESRRLIGMLTDEVSLLAYRSRARGPEEALLWTDALQAALDEHQIVRIPAGLYLLDGSVTIPSNRRIEAEEGAVIRLTRDTRVLMLRSRNTQDGTRHPIDPSRRDVNISIDGGCWEESNTGRAGYGKTGLYDPERSFFGVSTCLFFNNVDHLSLTNMTFRHTAGFAVQAGDASHVWFEHIVFEECYADGLHLNGNLQNVIVRDVRGQVGDDLVALNMYDWQNSSVDFGPMDTVLCENLALSPDSRYKAMRIEPGIYLYDDGSRVDCSLTRALIRGVRGINPFKLYYQTPPYRVGVEQPEPGGVGSGDDLFFEDIEVDLQGPVDGFPEYTGGDPVRGAFAPFEIGANLGRVHFENIRLTKNDRFPMAFLAVVGPKSVRVGDREIFDPYAGCVVDELVFRDISVNGREPVAIEPPIFQVNFDDVNRDGHSTARGEVRRIRYLR